MFEQFSLISSKLNLPSGRALGIAALPVAGLVFLGLPARSGDRPNVVLISIDTLRADHMGCYGYERDTTPRIDAWARDAVRFEQATSTASTTLPSHMSMFTALHPEAHGVVPREDELKPQLSSKRVTLAQRLRNAGYETAGVVQNCTWLAPEFGFDRGFDSYSVVDKDARQTNDDVVLPWLQKQHDAPFFLFVHYYDVHSDWTKLPYDSPAPFDTKFTSGYQGSFTGCGDGLCATRYLLSFTEKGMPLSREDHDYVVGLYDNGIAFTDSEVGRVLESLSELGLSENTIVMIVADHGESFNEHGCMGHCSLHEEAVHVPWMISWPGHLEPRVLSTPVQTVDLMPTLLQLVGLSPVVDAQGISRVDEILGRTGNPARASYANAGSLFSIRKGQWKLHHDSETDRRELYDLESDPRETRDLITRHLELAKEMSARLEFFRADNRHLSASAPAILQSELTVEEREKQLSLGYVQ